MKEKDYFLDLKSKIKKITDKDLEDFYKGCLLLVDKYKVTGQIRILEKLRFLIDCVEKERAVIKYGINSFVYRDVIEEYIDKVANNTVKIIELENYPRDIPDNIVKIVADTKDIFDKMYVVFTDYTGKVEKQVKKERMEKDPIIFGTFQKRRTDNLSDGVLLNERFYYLGDWEDEYCDLTMDKFLKEVGANKLQYIDTPINEKQIKDELARLDDNLKRLSKPVNKRKSWFSRLFKGKNER